MDAQEIVDALLVADLDTWSLVVNDKSGGARLEVEVIFDQRRFQNGEDVTRHTSESWCFAPNADTDAVVRWIKDTADVGPAETHARVRHDALTRALTALEAGQTAVAHNILSSLRESDGR